MITARLQNSLSSGNPRPMEQESLYEFLDGQLVDEETSSLVSRTTDRIALHLSLWAENFSRAEVFPHQSFQCFPRNPSKMRRPDVAVIRAERLIGITDDGHLRIVPDVAVEVVSPNDTVGELENKLNDYRSAGVKLIWVVNPVIRMIRVYRPDCTILELHENDTLSGEDVLPGFSVLVKDLLPPASQRRTHARTLV